MQPTKTGESGKSESSMRIQTTVLFLAIALIVTSFGAVTPVSQQEIEDYKRFEKEELPHIVNVQYIFGNNYLICLGMLTPFAGPFWGAYVLFSTGKVFAAIGAVQAVHPLYLLATTFLFPFAWLEYLAYSLALNQSLWLTMAVFQRKPKRELRNTCIIATLAAVILLAAAIIEVELILLSGGLT